MIPLIKPLWPAPATVNAMMTTRTGGYSQHQYATLNLADHVKDDPAIVQKNRAVLKEFIPSDPVWLNQQHTTNVLTIEQDFVASTEKADAAVTRQTNRVLAVMTADCLPILLCNRAGTVVGAVHAGWRGLCEGIIEKALLAMECSAEDIYAWLGPAIGPDVYEVGEEVRTAFITVDPEATLAFKSSQQADKWLCNLYLLAKQRLVKAKVSSITGGEYCTYTDKDTFFSYRRENVCGRMASLIWLS